MYRIMLQNVINIKRYFVKLFLMALPTCFSFGLFLLSGFLNEGPTSEYENVFIHFNNFESSLISIVCLIFFGLSILFYVSFILGFTSNDSVAMIKIRQTFKLFTNVILFFKYLGLIIVYFVILFILHYIMFKLDNLLLGIGYVIITFTIIPGIFITFNNLITLFYNYNIKNHTKSIFGFIILYFKIIFTSMLNYILLIIIFTGLFLFIVIIFFSTVMAEVFLLHMIDETILNGLFYIITAFFYALGCIVAVWFNLVLIDLNKKSLN